jgi:hypothetical protein
MRSRISFGQRLDRRDRIARPFADRALGELARRFAVPGIVEAQERMAARLAHRFERQRLVAFHVRAEAGQKDDTWPLALGFVVGDSRTVRTVEKFGHCSGRSIGHEAGRMAAVRKK